MNQVFLTGGTGFLGSHLAAALLAKGYRVCLLTRSAGQQSAEHRVASLLDWFGVPADARRALRVVDGDITRPYLGIDRGALGRILHETEGIIHCASCTAFSERKRAELEHVNVLGLSHVLQFAASTAARAFHHVSTAYVAGKASGSCAEEPSTANVFHNPYEETKCQGERMVLARCPDMGVTASIYRPSIVYGDSRTGRSLLFNALYHPVRTAVFIRDLYRKDIAEKGGTNAAELGVRTEPDGALRLPLRIEVVPDGGFNLIPVDYFTEAFLTIMERAHDGGIFHIANPHVTTVELIIEYASRLFGLTGIEACRADAFAARPRNAIEVLFDRYVAPYVPYMNDRRRFEIARSGAFLANACRPCPEFDYEMFARCMSFAVESGWHSPLQQADAAGRA
jgi:nucleoside-diphosphate-sugar epimerase